MNYEELVNKGLLKKEEIGFDKVQTLIENAYKKLQSSRLLIENEDSDNSFQLAYDAMLLSGRALIFSHNLRPRAAGSHKIVVQFVGDILGNDYKSLVGRFDKTREDRNYLIYGVGLTISMTEAQKAIDLAETFIKTIEGFIEAKNPQIKLLKNDHE